MRLVITEVERSSPAGVHAGSPRDPQAIDRPDDSTGPAFADITGVWIDQPDLGDGLIEVGLVIPGLADYSPCGGQGAACEGRAGSSSTPNQYAVTWMLLGEASELDFTGRGPTVEDGFEAHLHFRFVHDASAATDAARAGPAASVPAFADPANRTLRALVPLRFLGDPPREAQFTNLTGLSGYFIGGQR